MFPLFWPVLAIYTALITWCSACHEVWRDEVVPVTLAFQSHSLPELLHNIRYYGHPALWFVLLYYAVRIFPHYSVLKIVNWTINILAAGIFLKKAPFPWFQRVLFLLGYFPLYYFPVVNRHYGLSWLWFLLFYVLYAERWRRIVPLGLVLCLLTNTTETGIIISAAVLLVLACEGFWNRKNILQQVPLLQILLGFLLIALGMAVAIVQVHTDSRSSIFDWHTLTLSHIIHAAWQGVFWPGKTFTRFLGGEHMKLAMAGIAGCYLVAHKDRTALAIMFLSVTGLSMFFQLVYPYYKLYHENFVYLLMLWAFWVTAKSYKPGTAAFYLRHVFFTVVLLLEALMAFSAFKADITGEFSSSRTFAQWIKSSPHGRDYVLMGEPDFLMFAMPYYVGNSIYSARQSLYTRIPDETVAEHKTLSLEGFLDEGKKLKARGKDVLLVMGLRLKEGGPYQIRYPYGKLFQYSPDSLELWKRSTKEIASFRKSFYADENYDIYVLK